jgi:hypothetical protein
VEWVTCGGSTVGGSCVGVLLWGVTFWSPLWGCNVGVPCRGSPVGDAVYGVPCRVSPLMVHCMRSTVGDPL